MARRSHSTDPTARPLRHLFDKEIPMVTHVKSADDLFAAMTQREPWVLLFRQMGGGKAHHSYGLLQAVERESGCGRSFNVRILNVENRPEVIHVRFDN